ncbi:ABC transporter ATP-binding protein [Enterococcus songbeiensis]|uniref:ABC transporter ATP-binding protein n=1 Tax=Enterococcus songbeiensis TaxID=2559927 RepID=UPI001BB167B2|nr:ABC transporter ATP-binding protein [Enterococcus songbeiensis]
MAQGGFGMRSFTKDNSVKGTKLKKGTTKRVLTYAAPYKWLLALFLFLIMLNAAIGALTPLILKTIIDTGITNGDIPYIVNFSLLAGGLAIASAFLTLGERWLSSKIGEGVIFDLQTQLFQHIQKMSLSFFSRTKTGALVQRINGDVTGAQAVFTQTLSSIFSNTLSVTFVLIAMFSMSWQLTLVALLLVPAFIIPARIVGPKLAKLMRESYDLKAEANQLSNERFNVAGAQLAKTYGTPESDAQQYSEQIRKVRDLSIKQTLTGSLMRVTIGTVSALSVAVVYGLGGVLAVRGTLTVGIVVALASYLNRLYAPITSLSNVQVDVLTAMVSFERVFEILDLEPSVKELPNAQPLTDYVKQNGGSVTFDQVDFRYPTVKEVSLASLELMPGAERESEEPILKNVSFTIQPGHMTALVGPSGAGKSTLSQLLTRMYDPQQGEIRIGEFPLKNATLDSVRQTIGVVSQDAHMFHDTIANNLRYAKPDATPSEIEEALKEAYIWELISSLPEGIDTVIGDRGYRLSGGERQRLAIARLLLKAPAIVILDEATAHLDSESEHYIQEALKTALAGRTSLVIAHRLSTVREADQILVLEKGRILQMGTHEKLIQESGLYRELYHLQFE